MKFRSIAVGLVLGTLATTGIAAWAQDAKPSEKRSILTQPSEANRSASESAVRDSREDAARRAKARRERLAAQKRKRQAKQNPQYLDSTSRR